VIIYCPALVMLLGWVLTSDKYSLSKLIDLKPQISESQGQAAP
jgi:hypothetical protein